MPERRFEYVERVREQGLSPPDEITLHMLWQIVDEGVLGAANHVRLTQELLVHVLQDVMGLSEAWIRAEGIARFITETRGEQAPVVGNVIRLLMGGLSTMAPEERLTTLTTRIAAWQADSEHNRARLVATAVTALEGHSTLIAYDYSSTVAAIVEAVCRARPNSKIVVPESRAIAGGRRYLETFVRQGIAVHYVLDAAFEQLLDATAVVLLGAESLRCDGSLTNTVGSRPLARLANWRQCPVFGCAELLKLDLRSYRGVFAQPAPRSFEHLLDGADLPANARVTTEAAELEIVPAGLITGFFTEHGLVPPGALWSLGREVFGPVQDEPPHGDD